MFSLFFCKSRTQKQLKILITLTHRNMQSKTLRGHVVLYTVNSLQVQYYSTCTLCVHLTTRNWHNTINHITITHQHVTQTLRWPRTIWISKYCFNRYKKLQIYKCNPEPFKPFVTKILGTSGLFYSNLGLWVPLCMWLVSHSNDMNRPAA